MKRIIEYPERTKSYEIGDVVYLSPNPKDKVEFLGENIEVAKGIKKIMILRLLDKMMTILVVIF